MAVSLIFSKPVVCQRCGCTSERTASGQRYCPPCAPIAAETSSKKRARARTLGIIGSSFQCEFCGEATTRTSGTQRYCRGCKAEAKRNQNTVAARERRKRPEAKKRERERSRIRNPMLKEYRREYERRRRRADPKFTVQCRMKAMVQNALRGRKAGRAWEKPRRLFAR